jgi:SAM-dependent methyltransferase
MTELLKSKLLDSIRSYFEPTDEKIANAYLQDLGLTWDFLKDKSILDIGAGSGGFAHAAKRRGVEIIPLDEDPQWWKTRGMFYKHVPYVQGTAFHLPFLDESFDLIISREAVEYMVFPKVNEDKRMSLQEIRDGIERNFRQLLPEVLRVLRPNGEFRFDIGVWGWALYTTEESSLQALEKEKSDPEFRKQRAEKIAQRSLEFLQSIYPHITMHTPPDETGDDRKNYFRMIKSCTVLY